MQTPTPSLTPSLRWKRTLRTPSSERYLCVRGNQDAAAVDLHFLPTGQVVGTVILLDDAGWTEEQIPHLLKSLDDDFLPGVDLGTGGISFTVVSGRVIANYEADGTPE